MNCKFLVTSSITYALKGRSELQANGISCTLEKLDDLSNSNGCGYGISVNRNDEQAAVYILKKAGIKVIKSLPCNKGGKI